MHRSKTIKLNRAVRKLFFNRKVCTVGRSYRPLRFELDDNIILQEGCKIEPYAWINAGNVFCTMGAFSYSHSPLRINFNIGRYVSIAGGLSVIGNHPYERFTTSTVTYNCPYIYKKAIEDLSKQDSIKFETIPRPIKEPDTITIAHDVWIGASATLKPGITIGQGAIIGTKAVVTHDVPPYSIWGGVPARLIKMRFDDTVIERLMRSEWWEYAFPQFAGLNILDPVVFCDEFEELKAKGLKKFYPEPLTFDEIVKCYEDYDAYNTRITKAKTLAENHWFINKLIKILTDNKRYKKLSTDPERFFADSKSELIKFFGKYYSK